MRLPHAGSFGLCDPASKEMHHYLERLEEQQKLVLELITGKKQALLEQYANKGASRNKVRPLLYPCPQFSVSLLPILPSKFL